MRITDNLINKNFYENISRTRKKMVQLQSDIATTKKVRTPSDDPIGFSRATRFKLLKSRNEQYSKNIQQVSDHVSGALAAIDSAVDIVSHAKELAVQAANGTLEETTRGSIAKEVDQMIESLVTKGNAKHDNRFIFAGTQTLGDPPFVRNGDVIQYNGDDGVIKNTVGDGVEVATNKPGTEVFKPGGGVDIFDSMIAFKQALEQNDVAAIENSIDDLGQSLDHLLTVSADFAGLQNRLDATEELIQSHNLKLTDAASRIEDTDVVKTIIDFQNAQNAYTFALRSFQQLIDTSLINFLS
ncbi:MAG: flagellar hook-associated protein FlgL [bacterium]